MLWRSYMVVIRTPDGATAEYRLRRTQTGLRLELRCASYDLVTMVLEAGWQIVGTRTHVAERLLLRAGLLTSEIDRLPPSRRSRWRTLLHKEPPQQRHSHATPR